MARKTRKTRSTRQTGRGKASGNGKGRRARGSDAAGKHLVIVESPAKARTINKYLGPDYVVKASIGHVRDLPKRNPKGVDRPVPGVDLERDFEPTYELIDGKGNAVSELRRAAKSARDVWLATDLDREGEAIAWHLAEALGVPVQRARRVVFNAITRDEIRRAFERPRSIDMDKVNAQQARRILDRIVGYQVSPLLWKKVAGGLSAGRVQSVAVRLVVEREREIAAFVPEEYWKITGVFACDVGRTEALAEAWLEWLDEEKRTDDHGKVSPRTNRQKLAWLSEHRCLQAELVAFEGEPFKPPDRERAMEAARRLGFVAHETYEWEDPKGKGPARRLVRYEGAVDRAGAPGYRIESIETRRTTSKPSPPFITSTMQQAAANRLGFPLQRTMRIAQQLYEGVDIHGKEGQTGLITYMRTDSTHLSGEAIRMARQYIDSEWGGQYLPEKPKQYASSNKDAQEAHEAIRPTDVRITPKRVRHELTEDQYKLYKLIWERFLASQCTPAQWDSTTVLIAPRGVDATFRATGRKLVFDGYLRAVGLPQGDELILPADLERDQPVGPLRIDPTQHFTSPPPRYTEASLQKKLEEEGIGRPSTYAPIIQTIQDRKYVEPVAPRERRLRATDLGMVVTDKLVEGFPRIMDVGYTRWMEDELDAIEDQHHDWVQFLHKFYGPFRENLERAHEEMEHAKAETEPAPYECPQCGAETMYRFGRNGRFLSCSRYPDCKHAAPIDREGRPVEPEKTEVACPKCGEAMMLRKGRYGPFLSCGRYPDCDGIVNLDRKGHVTPPKVPPLQTDLECPKCGSPLNLRSGKRGPWLSCSRFPKCRGRLGWTKLEPPVQQKWERALAEHERANPQPVIRTIRGELVGEQYTPRSLAEAEGDVEAVDSDSSYDTADIS